MQQPVGGVLGFLGRLRAEKLQYSDFSVGYILLDHYAAKYSDNMLQPFPLVSGRFGSIALHGSSVDRLGNIVKFTLQSLEKEKGQRLRGQPFNSPKISRSSSSLAVRMDLPFLANFSFTFMAVSVIFSWVSSEPPIKTKSSPLV